MSASLLLSVTSIIFPTLLFEKVREETGKIKQEWKEERKSRKKSK